jgi:triphosphatase
MSMGMEHEIKLALPPSSHEAAIAALDRRGGPGRDVALANVYFDTPEHALRGRKCALRLRRAGDLWLQTMKAGGSVRDGLHSRHEWELPVAGAALDVDALAAACDDADARAALLDAAPRLVELFRTDFVRTLWQLDSGDALVEAALDRGAVVAGTGADAPRTPISEVELELKRGDAAALHRLARALQTDIPDLKPEDASKAQRGFALLCALRRPGPGSLAF